MSARGSSDRYQLVETLYQRACDLPPERREAFLQAECGADAQLRSELASLLGHYAAASSNFLATPVHDLERRSDADRTAPQRIGTYTIIRMLGRGGMGAVYEAEQSQPRRRIALKVVRSDAVSEHSLRRFRHEAEALGQLKHPGIAQIYEFGVGEACFRDVPTQPQPFFAMELVEGRPLCDYAAAVRLKRAAVLQLFAHVCDAVQHAHQKGVIHRDLKPANILVTAEGQPKILDFGVARITDADAPVTTMHTQDAQVVGTVPYMSPEQVSGRSDQLDTRSDIYALGVILYELLAGRLPYDLAGKSLVAAARVISEQPPIPLGSVNRACRGDLETIVHKALQKDPARRYPSAHALASDVRRCLTNEPIEARRDSRLYVARKLLARYRVPIGAAAAFMVLLAVSTVVLSVLYHERGELLVRAQSAEDRHRRRFDQVRSLAQSLMFDLHPKIERLAGATPARVFLINSATQYLDSLAQDAGDDPALQRELAEANQRLAAVQGNPNYVNIGDAAGALASYQKSQEWFEKLAAGDPDDVYAQRMLGQNRSGMGDIFDSTGRAREAEESYQKAFEIAADLNGRFPDSWEVQLDLALAHVKRAAMLAKFGKPQDALARRHEAVALFEKVVAGDPTNEKARVQLAVAYVQVGDSLLSGGDAEAALRNYEDSLSIRRELAAAAPDNVDHLRSVAIGWQRVGNAQAALPAGSVESDTVLSSYRESLSVFEQLARSDPQDIRGQRDLSVAHEKIGVMRFKAGQWSDALDSFRPSQDIRQRLSAMAPDNAEFVSDLIVSLAKIGQTCTRLEDFDAARSHLEGALQHAQSLHARDPANTSWARRLAMAQSQLGGLCGALAEKTERPAADRLNDWRQARDFLTDARQTLVAGRKVDALTPAESKDITGLDSEIDGCDRAIQELARINSDEPAGFE